jgi:transcriptional regulator with XRE-family HTH domain
LVTLLGESMGAVLVAGPGQPSTFSRRLREARERAGYSQYELGLRAGLDANVAAPRINQYENGVHEPRQDIVRRVADALGVPPAYLYTADEDLARLLLAWPGLSRDKRRKLADLVAGKPEPTPTTPAKKRAERKR